MRIAPDMDSCDRKIAIVLDDPGVKTWVKDALRSALNRDPIDAANDAEMIADLLAARAAAALAQAEAAMVLSGYEIDETRA